MQPTPRKHTGQRLAIGCFAFVAIGIAAIGYTWHAATERDRIACGEPDPPTAAQQIAAERDRADLQRELDTNPLEYYGLNPIHARVVRVVGHRAYLVGGVSAARHIPGYTPFLERYKYLSAWIQVFRHNHPAEDGRASIAVTAPETPGTPAKEQAYAECEPWITM
jgi:hypothetical protein